MVIVIGALGHLIQMTVVLIAMKEGIMLMIVPKMVEGVDETVDVAEGEIDMTEIVVDGDDIMTAVQEVVAVHLDTVVGPSLDHVLGPHATIAPLHPANSRFYFGKGCLLIIFHS